jgi:hypothetical protein
MSKINDLTEVGGNSLYTGSVTYSYDTRTKILDLLQHQQSSMYCTFQARLFLSLSVPIHRGCWRENKTHAII